jgi:hypothetical protein
MEEPTEMKTNASDELRDRVRGGARNVCLALDRVANLAVEDTELELGLLVLLDLQAHTHELVLGHSTFTEEIKKSGHTKINMPTTHACTAGSCNWIFAQMSNILHATSWLEEDHRDTRCN